MRALTLIDQAFLLAETPERPTHIASLQIFEMPAEASASYLRRLLAELMACPVGIPFNCKLAKKTGAFHKLVEDEHFDIDYHVRHSVVPHPGSDEQLEKLVARLHANLLDRDRPLWELHLIEGLAGRRFALYTKIHHAVCDGATFSKWAIESMHESPGECVRAIWDRKSQPTIPRVEDDWLARLTRTASTTTKTLKSVADVASLGRKVFEKSLLAGDPSIVTPFGAPKTPFNVASGAARSIAGVSFPLDEIKGYGKQHGATVNDVVLAMTDFALNRYLAKHDTRPREPLVAMVPVNMRESGDKSEGNLVSILQIRLSSGFEDLADCLRQVRDSAARTKELYSTATMAAAQGYALLAGTAALIGDQLAMTDNNMSLPGNLIISNVPGPGCELYLGDAKMLNSYPISALAPMMALNVTVYSYAGQLQFGLIAGRRAVPELHSLVGHLNDAFDEIRSGSRS